MAKGKDFYGKEVTDVIEEACRDFGVSQEELDIEVLETGSAGIFGLCKKKAHIRVQKKKEEPGPRKKKAPQKPVREEQVQGKTEQPPPVGEEKKDDIEPQIKVEQVAVVDVEADEEPEEVAKEQKRQPVAPEPVEPPSEEVLAQIHQDVVKMLELMGYPSQVSLSVEEATLHCHLTGEHEEVLIGTDGRTLDSLQYLLRKMMSRLLPDRMMLALDAGDFRQRRTEELKERALQLAEEVKENGKTQAIPALNPAERREVHMILQEDKSIRSRSVGEGLFKKVLIYKPGKGQKPSSRKRKGRQGGRSSEN